MSTSSSRQPRVLVDSGPARRPSLPFRPEGNTSIVSENQGYKPSTSDGKSHEITSKITTRNKDPFAADKVTAATGRNIRSSFPTVVDNAEEENGRSNDNVAAQPGAFNVGGNLPTTDDRSLPYPAVVPDTATTAGDISDHQQHQGETQNVLLDNFSVDDEERPIEAFVPGNGTRRRENIQIVEGVVEEVPKANRKLSIVFVLACLLLAVGLGVGLYFGMQSRKNRTDNGGEEQTAESQQTAGVTVSTLSPSPAPTTGAPSPSPSTSLVPTSNPSNVPTSIEFEAVLQQLSVEFPNLPVDVTDSTSPTYRAAEWLAGQQQFVDELPFTRFTDIYVILDFRQRYALSVFYYATGGESWIDNCNFLNEDIHYCDWTCPLPESVNRIFFVSNDDFMGVKCLIRPDDWPGFATGITLVRNNLTGTIPKEIEGINAVLGGDDFDLLSELNVYDNDLEGTVPFEHFGRDLVGLTIVQNKFSGTISPYIGSYNGLVLFFADSNQMTGDISPIANLKPVMDSTGRTFPQTVWLGGNMFTGSLPEGIFSEVQWLFLDLQQNMLTGEIPDMPKSLQLNDLFLNDNLFSGTVPESIANMSPGSFDIGSNLLSGTIPQSLGRDGNNFFSIGFSNNQLSGTIPSNLWNMPRLTLVQVGDNSLTGSIPTEIGNCVTLETFAASGNDLTGTIPSEMGRLTMMTSIDLSFNNLIGSIPIALEALTQLDVLRLGVNNLSGNLDGVCDARSGSGSSVPTFTSDCFEDDITCSCCVSCCEVPDDNVSNCQVFEDCCGDQL